jgi:23S rRNA (guanosine2251-2'-O)-methyltransferase
MKNIFIALEDLRSLYNIGAIFRTCSFFGIKNVVLIGYSGKTTLPNGSTVLHEKVAKSSLGSEKDVDLMFLDTPEDFTKWAGQEGLKIIAAEQTPQSISLGEWKPEDNSVVVFGNEVEGISPFIVEHADKVIEIRRTGKHNSLNVTTACGIVMHKISSELG